MVVMSQTRNLIINSDRVMGFETILVPYGHWAIRAIVEDDYYTLAIYDDEDRAKKVLSDVLETIVNNYPGFEMPLK